MQRRFTLMQRHFALTSKIYIERGMPHLRPLPPPPLAIHLRTTSQILKQTTAIFSGNNHLFIFIPHSFLILSFLIFSFIDHEPSIKSLLSRLHISANPSGPPVIADRRRRRSFLQLTRVGTLDDGFFSG
ncbi:hypothetical protein R6Q59_019774 [Mikania micrantha]